MENKSKTVILMKMEIMSFIPQEEWQGMIKME